MTVQYASDLHLEFPQNLRYLQRHPLEVAGDILILAGDILYLNRDYIENSFWDWVSDNYQQVIVALGNHEFYYGSDLKEYPDKTVIIIRKNVNAFHNTVVNIDDVDFIVSTLWAKIHPTDAYTTSNSVSDFYQIMYGKHRLTTDDFNNEHERCLAFIKKAVAESTAKHKVVVTHHVPSMLLTAPEYKNSPINGAFTVELGDYIANSPIDYWIYGHSHRNIEKTIGNTRCVTNQLGYVQNGEHRTFNPSKHIDLKVL